MSIRKGSGLGLRALVWAPFVGAVLAIGGWVALTGGGPSPAYAQDPGPPGQGQGRGFGGFQGRMPFVFGTIASGDVNAGTIVVTSPMGGEQIVRVNATTRYYTQTTIAASALRVGDQVQVMGMPTAISANSITAGEMPNLMPGMPGMPGGQGARQGGAQAGAAGQGAGRQQMRQAFASASGRVTATSPLTISLGDNVSLVVRLAPNATVTRISETRLANLKVGDRILASGQAEDGGDFVASIVATNLQMGQGMGMGGGMGFGRRGSFGGFPGGPGGPEGPPMPPPGAPE